MPEACPILPSASAPTASPALSCPIRPAAGASSPFRAQVQTSLCTPGPPPSFLFACYSQGWEKQVPIPKPRHRKGHEQATVPRDDSDATSASELTRSNLELSLEQHHHIAQIRSTLSLGLERLTREILSSGRRILTGDSLIIVSYRPPPWEVANPILKPTSL